MGQIYKGFLILIPPALVLHVLGLKPKAGSRVAASKACSTPKVLD